MRIAVVIVCLAAWLAAPVVAAIPDACAHDDAGMAHNGAEDGHGGMEMVHASADLAPCDCDPGCAEHCEGASTPALVSPDLLQTLTPVAQHRRVAAISLYLDPPRSGLLRPPQHRIR